MNQSTSGGSASRLSLARVSGTSSSELITFLMYNDVIVLVEVVLVGCHYQQDQVRRSLC